MKGKKLLDILKEQKEMKLKGGLYHLVQIKLCYNTNRIEGSKLTEEQTRYIYETNTINTEKYKSANVDDIIETVNHFACFDYMLDKAEETISEDIIKEYHRILKNSTTDTKKEWFNVGEYKKLENVVGGKETAKPENVKKEIVKLLKKYNSKTDKNINDIIDFHYQFEIIHPFQDGNGRVGRLIMFKECLKNNIMPFIIEDEFKNYYYRGLNEFNTEKGYLTDTLLYAQDNFKKILKMFNLENKD